MTWRTAARRALIAGLFVALPALFAQQAWASTTPQPAAAISATEVPLIIAFMSSFTAITVALITLHAQRRDNRDARRATSTEATDALLEQLVEERRENDRLRRQAKQRRQRDGEP